MAKRDYSHWPLPLSMICGGIAGSFAEMVTIPVDTAKVRLQLQGDQIKQGLLKEVKYRGMFSGIVTIAKEEGTLALWKGCSAGVQRQMVNASVRIGLYEPVRNIVTGGKEAGLGSKILAALITGAAGICAAQPTDLVKIRLQAQAKGGEAKYSGSVDAYRKIIAEEGVLGLWTGLKPNIMRNAIINAAELATYDQVRTFILNRNLMNDSIFMHFTCGGIAGFAAVLIGSPVDVMKTRIMSAPPGKYSSIVDCFTKTLAEGPASFYSGFSSNFTRIVSWNIVMFMALEQIKKVADTRIYGSR